jgi:hypothetical protein
MSKKMLRAGWGQIPDSERAKLIKEVENWLLYRANGGWFESASSALLEEIYILRERIERSKDRGQ